MVKFNPPWFKTGIFHYRDNSIDSNSVKDEQETFLGGEKQLNPPIKPTVFSRLCSWAWVLSTFALIFVTMLLSFKLRSQLAIDDALRTYEIGFDTDLGQFHFLKRFTFQEIAMQKFADHIPPSTGMEFH